MNRVVEVEKDHYRVEDPQAEALWKANDLRDDEVLRRLVHGWVFLDVHSDWVAMKNPSGECERYKTKDEAFQHFGQWMPPA